MASANFLINSTGSSPTSPVSVIAGSTINFALASSAGVSNWNFYCNATDDLNDKTLITNAITINQVNKTATMTAPTGSCALQMFSVINNGINNAGQSDPTLTAECKVYVPTPVSGSQVFFAGETIQGGQNGWLEIINYVRRNIMG